MWRREFLGGAAAAASHAGAPAGRPNILWITGEDMSLELGCYGYPLVRTPHLDRLASDGVRFTHCFTSAPVCSSSRSAFNTGMYQTSIGAHHHRSHRQEGYRLPAGVRLVSQRLRDTGYFTANVIDIADGVKGTGKTDFNFHTEKPFEGTHWNQRKPGQPFFAHVNFDAAHKGPAFPLARKQKYLVNPQRVALPAYYADHPVIRDEFANYLDAVDLLDGQVGAVLSALERDRLAENTAVFFFGDNGRCLLRGKVWLYDPGIRVPLIVRWPGVIPKASIRDDFVSGIDFAATALALAGVPVPAGVQGRAFLGPNQVAARDCIFAARDRCGEAVDRVRCVRTRHYKYIRNFRPDIPYTQPHKYVEQYYPTLGVMKKLYELGTLDERQSAFMLPRKPPEELYDLVADPDEVVNLARSPEHSDVLADMRGKLERWMEETRDLGGAPEPEEARR